MADEIEDYWEGIRPPREPVPQASDWHRFFPEGPPSAELPFGITQDLLARNRGIIEVVRQGLYSELGRDPTTDEIITGLIPELVFRGRLLQLYPDPGRDFAPIRQTLSTHLGREPNIQEIQDAYNKEAIRTLSQYNPVPETQEELEALRPETPAGESLGNRVDPTHADIHQALIDGLGRDPTIQEMSEAYSYLTRGFNLTEHLLNRITHDLGALGFPPESITIDRSIEGDAQSLTIHMPRTQQTQLTGPGHSSVTFHRS